MVPKSKHILVREGESISAGDQIVDGAPDPHDILKIKGEKELSKYIVDEIQDVYRPVSYTHLTLPTTVIV